MNTASRRHLLQGLGALALLPSAPRAADATPPNILFIRADDMGCADLGVYGQRDFATPELDRLAAEGIRFTQGYANSAVCSATRFGLITGRYRVGSLEGADVADSARIAHLQPDAEDAGGPAAAVFAMRQGTPGQWACTAGRPKSRPISARANR